MGCNCGGSTPPSQQQSKTLAAPGSPKPSAKRRTGGPGQPGYAWNGPPRTDAK